MDYGISNEKQSKVAIVSSKSSFSVMGIQKKLQEAGIDGVSVRPNVFQIEQAIDENEPIIYYLEDEIYTPSGEDFLNEMRKLCLEQERLLILVGEEAEYEKASEIIPKSAIVGWFNRPVDMDALLETVEKALEGDIKPARQRHILIVDDDATYMRMLHEWMKDRYQITMLDAGTKAIHWLMDNASNVDLILLDCEMPSMDGPTVLHMLKEDPSTRSIPVMFLTGKSDKDMVIRAVGLGPEDYILKSIDKKELMDKLEDFFGRLKTMEDSGEEESDGKTGVVF